MKISNEQLYSKILEFESIFNTIDSYGVEDTAGYKNLIAIKDYTVKTREMFRQLQKENTLYKNQVMEQGKIISLLKEQMSKLQIKVYQNNSTA